MEVYNIHTHILMTQADYKINSRGEIIINLPLLSILFLVKF